MLVLKASPSVNALRCGWERMPSFSLDGALMRILDWITGSYTTRGAKAGVMKAKPRLSWDGTSIVWSRPQFSSKLRSRISAMTLLHASTEVALGEIVHASAFMVLMVPPVTGVGGSRPQHVPVVLNSTQTNVNANVQVATGERRVSFSSECSSTQPKASIQRGRAHIWSSIGTWSTSLKMRSSQTMPFTWRVSKTAG